MNAPSVSSVHGVGGRHSQPEKSPGCSRMCFSDAVVAVMVDMSSAFVTRMSFAGRRSVTLAGRHYADSATGELVGLDHPAACEC